MTGKPAWAAGARQGPLRRHKQLVFFACEGLIALHDERDASQAAGEAYTVITPDDFEYRAEGVGAFGKKASASDKPWQQQEARLMLRAAQDMKDCVKEAREMGDPNDPQVQAFWARHRRNDRIAFNFEFGAPQRSLDQMNRDAPNTGRTAVPTLDAAGLDKMAKAAGLTAAGDQYKIRRKPVKKPRAGQLILDL